MRNKPAFWFAVGALFLVPAAHPLLIPLVGVPSHLLWWIHVLPVALFTYWLGRTGAGVALPVSAALVGVGERTFGAGYGVAAAWATVWALMGALTFTNLLVAGFALYARRAARRYQVLFNAAVNGVIRTDAASRVEAANPAALRLFDLDWAALRGRRLDEIPPLRRLPPPMEIRQRGWSGTALVGRPGHETEVHLLVAAVEHDDPPGYQLLLVDRTHDVVHEREMERQAHLATLGEGMAGVAHELRNPLSVISAWSGLALEEGTTDSMREGLTTIKDQATRMADLIQEMLGFSRTRDDGKTVHLGDLVSRQLRMQRVARGKKVRLSERIEWTGEAALPGRRIEQILANLVSNAADAAPPGSGAVEVTLRQEAGDVLLEVDDNGPGVAAEVVDRVFDPFVTTKPSGTGLGLAISRRLAASMGGSLTVGRAPTGGARFTLRLPLTPGPAAVGHTPERVAV